MDAKKADASNIFGDVERIKHLVGVLEGHCERLDRDPGEITKTRLGTVLIRPSQEEADALFKRIAETSGMPADRLATWIVGDPDTVAERCSELLEAGLDGLIFNSPYTHELESVELIGQALSPLFAASRPV
jgi:alkanesulfonate monooxygenase SsuD/methylene tetrahydromethanopterin reductase-like flavin-dependent oxidoreductase (luciferase family)